MTDTVLAGADCGIAACGHGTAVAAVALGDDGRLVGVAPRAVLISIQVASIDPEDSEELVYFLADVIAGLDKVYTQRDTYDIAAVNLSIGFESYTSIADCNSGQPSLRASISNLRSAGIAVVASAGNDGDTDRLSAPACLDDVIGVGATNKTDELADFSNLAPFLDLLAPGEQIETADLDGAFALYDGTSFAAPHVAGAVAAMRSVQARVSLGQIASVLASTGVPITDVDSGLTFPRLDVGAAVAAISDLDLRTGSEVVYDTLVGPPAPSCGLIGLELLVPALFARRVCRRSRTRERA